MAKSTWPDLQEKRLRYDDRTWELTGDVDVRNSGELLAVEARQTDDVRHGRATLHFGLDTSGDSLNPGNLGEHFDRLERTANEQHLVVRDDHRTYRYVLQRLESG